MPTSTAPESVDTEAHRVATFAEFSACVRALMEGDETVGRAYVKRIKQQYGMEIATRVAESIRACAQTESWWK